jgi:hypothetical protein
VNAVTETMMLQAHSDLDQAKANAERMDAEAERVLAARASAHAEVARMEGVLDWLQRHSQPEAAVTLAGSQPQAVPVTPRFGNPVPGTTQADLCFGALEQFGRPVRTTEVRQRLESQGHNFTQMQVRSAIKYLARKGRIVGGNGTWQLPRASVQHPPVSPAAATGAATMNGVGGES